MVTNPNAKTKLIIALTTFDAVVVRGDTSGAE
jgi:hypothetical protein